MAALRLLLVFALAVSACSKARSGGSGAAPKGPGAPKENGPDGPGKDENRTDDRGEHLPGDGEEDSAVEPSLSIVAPESIPLVNMSGPGEIEILVSCYPAAATVRIGADMASAVPCGENVTLRVDSSLIPEGEGGVTVIVSYKGRETSAVYPVSKHTVPPTLDVAAPAGISAAAKNSVGAGGACEDGGKVKVTIEVGGDSLVFDDIACVSGAWALPAQDLSSYTDGPVKFTVKTSDKYGNETVAEFLSAIDSVAPTMTIDTPPSTWVNSKNIAAFPVEVNCSEASTIEVKVGGAVVGTGSCTGPGQKTVFVDLSPYSSDPSVPLDVVLTDLAGNASGVVSETYNIKTTLPSLAVDLPETVNFAEQGAVTVDVSCSEVGQQISYKVGSITGSFACAGSSFQQTIDVSSLSDGDYTITFAHEDDAGNEKTYASTFRKKATKPSLVIMSPESGAKVGLAAASAVSFSGTCSEEGRTVSVGSETATCNLGSFSLSLDLSSLADGQYDYTASQDDTYGNTGVSEPVTIDLKATQPSVTIVALTINSTNDGDYQLSGTCSETGAFVEVTGAVTGSAKCMGGLWAAPGRDTSSLAETTHTFTATHTDAYGNVATDSASALKDVTPPLLVSSIIGLSKNPYLSSSDVAETGPLLYVSAESGANLSYGRTATAGSCATLDDSDYASVAPTPKGLSDVLSDGSYKVCIRAKDAAGNSSFDHHVLVVDRVVTPIADLSTADGKTLMSWPGLEGFSATGACGEKSTVTASVLDAAKANLYDATETATCDGAGDAFSFATDLKNLPIPEGTFYVRLHIEDEAGNAAYQDLALEKDTVVSPSPRLTTLASSPVNARHVALAPEVEIAVMEPGALEDEATVEWKLTEGLMGVSDCRFATGYGATEPRLSDITSSKTGLMVCARVTDRVGNVAYAASNLIDSDLDLPSPGGAGSISVSAVGPKGARLDWSEGSDIQTATIALKYEVYVSTSPLATLADITANGVKKYTGTAASGHTLAGLTPSLDYNANVVVEDAAGNRSVYGGASFSTPDPVPGAFTVTGPSTPQTVKDFTITWTPSDNAAKYYVTVASDADCSTAIEASTVTPPATSYDYSASQGGKVYICVQAESLSDRRVYADNASTTSSYLVSVDLKYVIGQADMSSVTQLAYGKGNGNSYDSAYVYKTKLYVADSNWNRVVVYNWPMTQNNPAPVAVIGQPDIYSDLTNNDGSGSSQRLACQKCLDRPRGVTVQSSGGNPQYLWVSDYGNNRVLRFDLDSTTGLPTGGNHPNASLVLGQPDFTTSSAGVCQTNKLRTPSSISVVGTKLFVLSGENRIHYYNNPTSNGQAQTNYLGESDCSTAGTPVPGKSLYYPTTIFAYNDGANDILYCRCDGAPSVWGFVVTGGVTPSTSASYIWGQSSFSGGAYGAPSSGFDSTGGIFASSGKLYIVDNNQHRVLVYATNTPAVNANFAIGQTATNLGTAPSTPSATTLLYPMGVAGDSSGLFVLSAENRGYFYSGLPASNGPAANYVLAASSFTAPAPGDVYDKRFSLLTQQGSVAACEMDGKLYASDTANNRVLVWETIPDADDVAPTKVLGQTSLTGKTGADTQNGLTGPTWLFCDKANKKLFVTESVKNRIKIFDMSGGVSNNMNAQYVIGQPNFTSSGSATSQNGLKTPSGVHANDNNIFVADVTNNRVLVFPRTITSNGQNASYVLGPSSFTVSTSGATSSLMKTPYSVWADNTTLYVSDTGNNRVLIFDVSSISNGKAASGVLGQGGSFTTGANPTAPTQNNLFQPRGIFYDAVTDKTYLADQYFNRILVYDGKPASNASPSAFFGNGAGFTSWNSGGVSPTGVREPYSITRAGSHLLINDTGFRRILMRPSIP